MLTVCSHCKTRFRISDAQLKAAHGQVRCGKCHEVFDAFEALVGAKGARQESDKDLESVSAAADLTSPLVAGDEPAPELDVQGRTNAAGGTMPGAAMPPLMAVTEPPTEAPALKAGPRKGTRPPIDDLFADLMGEPRERRTPLHEVGAGLSAEQKAPEPGLDMDYVDKIEPPVDFTVHIPHEDLPLPPKARPKRPLVSALWWSGILLMALVLGLQLVNANRMTLAQNPVLGPSLMALYSTLGRPLPPPLSVSAWDVDGLNVTSDPQAPGVLSITGALQNRADFVQPWPYLRVELTDRYGQALRSRDFKPGDYLPPTQATALLAAGQATRFRIDIADPGADAVGFTLAPCFDLPAGRVCSASEHE